MELIDALNLRGWRTAAVIVVACVGAVVGLFVPRSTPYASQHIVFAGQLTSDNLTPAQIEDFTDELRLAASLPAVRDEVERQIDGEFNAEVGGTTSDSSIRITSTSESEDVARDSSRLIGVEAARFVIGQSIERNNSLVAALETELAGVLAEQDTITEEADGLDPAAALVTASELLFTAQQEAAGGDASAVIRSAALQREIDELRPLAQAYSRLEQDVTALNSELGQARADSARGQNALANIDNQLFITELSTKPQSAAPKLVQNMLLFAGLNVAALILVFFLIDRLGRGPATDVANDELIEEPTLDLTTESTPEHRAAVAPTGDGPRIEAPPARLTDGESVASRTRSSRERRLSATSSSRENERGAAAEAAPYDVNAEEAQESQKPTTEVDMSAEALEAAARSNPELVSTDLGSRDLTGDELEAEKATQPAKPSRPIKKKRRTSKPTTVATNGNGTSDPDADADDKAVETNGNGSGKKRSDRPAAKRVSR